jgi:hypothetical protein
VGDGHRRTRPTGTSGCLTDDRTGHDDHVDRPAKPAALQRSPAFNAR